MTILELNCVLVRIAGEMFSFVILHPKFVL